MHASFGGPPQPAGSVIGRIDPHWADVLEIPDTAVVGVGALDAHAGAVGAGIRPGVMAASIGTSTVNMLVEAAENLVGKDLAHVCGQAEDSVLPGLVGLETSQAAFGDIFAWLRGFLMWPLEQVRLPDALDPGAVTRVRQALREGLFEALTREANLLDPDSALTALDWFNGRRYPHLNESLSAALTGLSLGTTPPVVFKALVLAAVFGQKRIMESLAAGGIAVSEMIAVGGIPRKSPAVMQVLADVLGFPIRISSAAQAAARGAGMAAAVAAGRFPHLPAAQQSLCADFSAVYHPRLEKTAAYQAAYERYLHLGRFIEKAQ
jgi:L-ribulokinase